MIHSDDISRAVQILRAGGLVAFPTETVYGLGADAASADAVRRIFAAKGRPATNPIIVHVADETVARRYAGHWPDIAVRLARRFWPGPLTLVVPRSPVLADEVSAGIGTVGLRSPDHPVALELLRAFDGPIAAPSANRSTHISPTLARHVRADLGDAVDLILDGGACKIGIESTVLDVTGPVPKILRPGGISKALIETEIGPVEFFTGSVDPTVAAISPGQHAIHYAPRARAFRFNRDQSDSIKRWIRSNAGLAFRILSMDSPAQTRAIFAEVSKREAIIEMPATPEEYARKIYAALRDADQPGVDVILIEMPPDKPAWSAIRDRLLRATTPLPIVAP